jgi:hypothetical protein
VTTLINLQPHQPGMGGWSLRHKYGDIFEHWWTWGPCLSNLSPAPEKLPPYLFLPAEVTSGLDGCSEFQRSRIRRSLIRDKLSKWVRSLKILTPRKGELEGPRFCPSKSGSRIESRNGLLMIPFLYQLGADTLQELGTILQYVVLMLFLLDSKYLGPGTTRMALLTVP